MEYIKPYTEGVEGITAEEDGRLKDDLLTSFPKLCGQKGFEFHMDITRYDWWNESSGVRTTVQFM